jgi:hypothetical protein
VLGREEAGRVRRAVVPVPPQAVVQDPLLGLGREEHQHLVQVVPRAEHPPAVVHRHHRLLMEGMGTLETPKSVPGTNKQFGKKFGEHRDSSRPGYRDHNEYRSRANELYNNPNAEWTRYRSGETFISDGKDILRLDPNGNFRSLYPVD